MPPTTLTALPTRFTPRLRRLLLRSPGSLLRVEASTDTKLYHLPPGIALSRIIYQSLTLFSRRVPVSAAILWPYAPRSDPDGKFQVVAWAHGTSGISPKCAPSNMKNLWQHYLAPFTLVLQGYVVVCTDYSGMGVGVDANGMRIQHEYLCSVSQAHDVFYSVQAAREAFPELGKSLLSWSTARAGPPRGDARSGRV